MNIQDVLSHFPITQFKCEWYRQSKANTMGNDFSYWHELNTILGSQNTLKLVHAHEHLWLLKKTQVKICRINLSPFIFSTLRKSSSKS